MVRNGLLIGTALVVAATGCGASSDADPADMAASTAPASSSATRATSSPTTTTQPARPDGTAMSETTTTSAVVAEPVEVEQRIIPVDGDLAEIVFALGLGDAVVATDISATYPEAADELPEIGYQRALAAEPIVAFEPTIVLATDIAGPEETLDDLERLGVEVVMVPSTSHAAGPGDKIRAVAGALGVVERGAELANAVDAEIARAAERAEAATDAPKVGALYVRGENVQLLLGEGGGVDWMIEAAGAIDVADELGVVENAPINAEALVKAAPDVLVIPARGLDSVGGLDGLLELPGIAETPAGRTGRILAYDDQYLLGNGPRTGQFLQQFITDIHGDI